MSAIAQRVSAGLRQRAWRWSAAATQALERNRYKPSPGKSPVDDEIVSDLETNGIHVTSLEWLALPGTDRLLEEAAAWCRKLAGGAGGGDAPSFAVLAEPRELVALSPDLLLWGLQDRLFDALEGYARLKLRCLGVFMRRDLADGAEHGTRRWHIDINDFRYLKVIVYLNDVTDNGGPFEYLSDAPSRDLLRAGRPKSVDHARVMQALGTPWRSCPGPAGTVIVVDTARLYHRGKPPGRDRYTLMYSYASRRPSRPDLCAGVRFPPGLARLDLALDEKQWARLDWQNGRGQ